MLPTPAKHAALASTLAHADHSHTHEHYTEHTCQECRQPPVGVSSTAAPVTGAAHGVLAAPACLAEQPGAAPLSVQQWLQRLLSQQKGMQSQQRNTGHMP
jgi:hypothetical protein